MKFETANGYITSSSGILLTFSFKIFCFYLVVDRIIKKL